MEVVLSILNVLGWILLIILLLSVLAVLLILFHPLCYELEGSFDKTARAQAKIVWLFRLLRIRAVYEDALFFIEIKLAGFTKNIAHELKSTDAESADEENADEEDLENQDAVATDLENEILDKHDQNMEVSEQIVENLDDEMEYSNEQERANDSEKTEDSGGIISKIKGILKRIRTLYPKVKKMITDKRNHAAVLHIKNELLYLIKLLLPKKSKVDAVFSAGSPDVTGKTYGVIVCLPIVYRDHWQLLPDFEADDAYFRGYFKAIGRIYGVHLLGCVIRLVFDKDCQRMYKMLRRFIKSLKQN